MTADKMNIVEMQPAMLPSSFPVSDTRPTLPHYSKHDHTPSQYVSSRQSSKENRTPPPVEPSDYSPTSAHSVQSLGLNRAAYGSEHCSPPSLIAGKKRLANGVVKSDTEVAWGCPTQNQPSHSRNASDVSTISNTAVLELSQQLRTRLTYAMIKVQNGWQNRSLEEVESLASVSPRSTTFNPYSENRHLLSPRVALSTHLNHSHSDTNSDSNQLHAAQPRANPTLMSPPASRKGLAPPANIVSRPSQTRRRPTPNMHVNTGQNGPPVRPAAAQRTPSQNAAMEADAVETLLFMASPHNSGNHPSQLSPVTSVPSVHQFSSQTSPLRNGYSTSTSPKRVAFSSDKEYCARFGRDKKAIIASLVERLDEDDNRELDEALKLMDRHHAAKVAAV